MATLVRDGLELRYEELGGSGPMLLLPHLNFSWSDYLDLSPFTERFTVITASPRGFAHTSCCATISARRGSTLTVPTEFVTWPPI